MEMISMEVVVNIGLEGIASCWYGCWFERWNGDCCVGSYFSGGCGVFFCIYFFGLYNVLSLNLNLSKKMNLYI